jgi:hypothetical protein
MPTIDPRASMKLQSELLPDENILWSGTPNMSVIFHSEDWYLLPFSLLWGGFAIFWEAEVAGLTGGKVGSGHPWAFGTLFGLVFVVIGQYLIWGRFVMDAWLKHRTYYAVTDRRVLFLQEGFKRQSRVVYLDSLSEIQHEGSSYGRIWLGPRVSMFGGRGQQRQGWSSVDIGGSVPILVDIDNVDSVYRLLIDIRAKRAQAR